MELFVAPIRVHVLLFSDTEGKEYSNIMTAVKDAAVKYRTQAVLVEVNKDENLVLESFNLTKM